MRQEKIDTNNLLLDRPLTWAEEAILKTARLENLDIHRAPPYWPKWLIRYVMKPLIDVGILIPFANNEYFQLSRVGRQLAWSF